MKIRLALHESGWVWCLWKWILLMMKPKNAERDGRKAPKPPPVPAPGPVPPLFRMIDWLALAITFAVIWTVYLLTLAPELTLEDSGELVTGRVLRRDSPSARLPGVDDL